MMDSMACTDQSKEHDSVVRISNNSNVETSNNASSQSPKANMLLPLGPVTPDSIKEIGDVPFDLNSSPLTGPNNPLRTISFDTENSNNNGLFISTDCSSPQTGTHAVFDPFAPCHEDMILAPLSKRPTRKPKLSVSRRLDFYSSDVGSNDANSASDDEMIETVYENLLEIIVSMQSEGGVAELSKPDRSSDDDCKTPPLAPRINGIAETCPYAPVKREGESKDIDLGSCRKLQF